MAFRYQTPRRPQTPAYKRAMQWWQEQSLPYKKSVTEKNGNHCPSTIIIQRLAHHAGVI